MSSLWSKRKVIAHRTIHGVLVREIDPEKRCPRGYSVALFVPAFVKLNVAVYYDPDIKSRDLHLFVESWWISEFDAAHRKGHFWATKFADTPREPDGSLGTWEHTLE